MILLFPVLLLGLLVLPMLWWLLRALPPAPRRQSFPPLRLLLGLRSQLREARRVPPWLLILRLAGTALLVLALAQPILVARRTDTTAPGGTLLLAIDNGWAAAADWPARLLAADDALQAAGRAHRPVSLLLTAPDRNGVAPAPTAPAEASGVRARLRGETPLPWPVDRAAAARTLQGSGLSGSVLLLSDGLAGPGDSEFAAALAAVGPVRELRGEAPIAVPERPTVVDDGLRVKLRLLPSPATRTVVVRGETEAGGVLARQSVRVPAGAAQVELVLQLPTELRNQLGRIAVDGAPGAGAVRLLDEGDRRRPVGLLNNGGADTPLVGSLFFLRRALAPVAELRESTLDALLSRPLSVIVAPDGSINGDAARDRLLRFVRGGGTLIRFAGPRLAADTAGTTEETGAGEQGAEATGAVPGAGFDPARSLLPVPLLGGARQLGGAMSWSRPEHPAPFGADTPFADLAVPAEVTVSRQVLAQPDAQLGSRVWARLADGTPLVTHVPLGSGQIVLFHVTSTADWSNLPLSGLFPLMLQRLVQRAAGVDAPDDHAVLPPFESLLADGQLGPVLPAARGLESDRFGSTAASFEHPAGLYGAETGRRALNLSDAMPAPAPESWIGTRESLSGRRDQHALGPALLALSLLLLLVDLVCTLALRGLLPRIGQGRAGIAVLLMLLLPLLAAPDPVRAQPGNGQSAAPVTSTTAATTAAPPTAAAGTAADAAVPGAALETRLAYVVTGDDATDSISRQGLEGLSRYANARTSARLGTPDGVVPGRDDLAYYPLLYWPVTPATVHAAPSAAWEQALNGFMSRGGILLIDTQGQADGSQTGAGAGGNGAAGSDNDFVPTVPGTRRALRLATGGLDIPPLAMLPQGHVLNRTFYLLHGMPGRYAGAPVWGADAEDAGNDGVSPVLIGANDWAAAWATDDSGGFPFATIPGGEEQRTQAYRFGVNAVIYALTGNYKSDQVHVPALLKRLGQAGDAPGEDATPDASTGAAPALVPADPGTPPP